MAFTGLTDEQQEEIIQMMKEANTALNEERNQDALEIADDLAEFADNIMDAVPDDAPIAFDFENMFQELLYNFRQQRRMKQIPVILPMCRILLLQGVALMKCGYYEDAQPVLERALGWNPVGTQAAFAYAECCKALDDRSKFFVVTKEILTYATEQAELARCYRNLGWYFVELQDFEAAKACYLFSLSWEPHPQVQPELEHIDQLAGKHIEDPDLEQVKFVADQYNFQLGPDRDVVGLAVTYGREMLAQRQYDSARYFLEIANRLIDDEGIKALLAQVEREEKEPQQA